MKKFWFLLVYSCLLTYGINAFGQASAGDQLNFDRETLISSAKAISDADKGALENIKAIHPRMHKDFAKNFSSASDIRITPVNKSTSISCKVNGILNRILYDKNGRWQHTIRYYELDMLPEDVSNAVKDSYPRFTLFGGVIEVNVGQKKAYLVTIEDKKTWKRIKVVDGATEVYEDFIK